MGLKEKKRVCGIRGSFEIFGWPDGMPNSAASLLPPSPIPRGVLESLTPG